MDFTKLDILNLSWCQLLTYSKTIELAEDLFALEKPTEEEYNEYWNIRKGTK